MTPRCPQLLPALRERPGKTQELRIVVVNPVLIDEEDGIIAGHGRVLAAHLLGLDEVPCIVLAHLTPAQRLYAGWNRAENGAAGEGAAMIRDGLARYRAAGSALSLPLYLASLASVEKAVGNQQAALELLGEAQVASTAGDEHWMLPEIHRVAGKAMLAGHSNAVGAEREFHAALSHVRT